MQSETHIILVDVTLSFWHACDSEIKLILITNYLVTLMLEVWFEWDLNRRYLPNWLKKKKKMFFFFNKVLCCTSLYGYITTEVLLSICWNYYQLSTLTSPRLGWDEKPTSRGVLNGHPSRYNPRSPVLYFSDWTGTVAFYVYAMKKISL